MLRLDGQVHSANIHCPALLAAGDEEDDTSA